VGSVSGRAGRSLHGPRARAPGTSPDAPDDIYKLDGLWDLVLCYDELLEALGLESAGLVGHSFGAMVACELAAAYPWRARRLALIDPLGFWRDSDPVVNWMMMSPGDLPAQVFQDPSSDVARRMFGTPGHQEDALARVRHVGDGGHGQVHLAHSRQGAQEADPSRARAERGSRHAEDVPALRVRGCADPA
jgi:pimeloyl-ACP methyl ester carboxylesterase